MSKERRELFRLTFSDNKMPEKIMLTQTLIRHFPIDESRINEGHFTDCIQFAGYGGFEPHYPIFGMIGDHGFLMRAEVTHIKENGVYMNGTIFSPNGNVKFTSPIISELELNVDKKSYFYHQNSRMRLLLVHIDALLIYPFINGASQVLSHTVCDQQRGTTQNRIYPGL